MLDILAPGGIVFLLGVLVGIVCSTACSYYLRPTQSTPEPEKRPEPDVTQTCSPRPGGAAHQSDTHPQPDVTPECSPRPGPPAREFDMCPQRVFVRRKTEIFHVYQCRSIYGPGY
eukprot:2427677-Pyramimonas_sp.AAC.1